MRIKPNFIEVYERLILLKHKIKEDKEISSDFKSGFNYCLKYISESREFYNVNTAIENKKLCRKIEELEYKIKERNRLIYELKNTTNNKSNHKGLNDIKFTVNDVEVNIMSNIDSESYYLIKDEFHQYISSNKKRTPESSYYSNRAVDFLLQKGFKATKI